jgi:hypothetical protein
MTETRSTAPMPQWRPRPATTRRGSPSSTGCRGRAVPAARAGGRGRRRRARDLPRRRRAYVAAFDTEERLAAFAGRIAPYAALSGPDARAAPRPRGLGLALNPEAPRPPDAPAARRGGLARRRARGATGRGDGAARGGASAGRPARRAPRRARRQARHGHGASRATPGSPPSPMPAAARPSPRGRRRGALGAEPAIARADRRGADLLGSGGRELDVDFLPMADPAVARIAKVGLRFDLRRRSRRAAPARPGMDPDRPPRLR